MLAGLETPVANYVRALEFRKQVEAAYESALVGIDAYVVPTSPIVPEPIADDPTEERPPAIKFRNTAVFDNTHQPSVSVPNGFDAAGLPTGLMISTALFKDAHALRIAHAYQQATSFHERLYPERSTIDPCPRCPTRLPNSRFAATNLSPGTHICDSAVPPPTSPSPRASRS